MSDSHHEAICDSTHRVVTGITAKLPGPWSPLSACRQLHHPAFSIKRWGLDNLRKPGNAGRLFLVAQNVSAGTFSCLNRFDPKHLEKPRLLVRLSERQRRSRRKPRKN